MTRVWKEQGYEAFAGGTFGNGGQNLYVSRNGVLQRIFRYDLNRDGYADAMFVNSHDMNERPDVHAYRCYRFTDITDADMSELMSEMAVSFQKFMLDNGELFDSVLPAEFTLPTNGIGNSETYIARPEAVRGESVEVGSGIRLTTYTIETAYPAESIQYPVISGLADKGVEEQINTYFKEASTPLVTESDIAEIESYGGTYEYVNYYEVTFRRGYILNVVFSNYLSTGEAQVTADMISVIVNVNTGEIYRLSDLFTKDGAYYDVVNALILEQDVDGILSIMDRVQSIKI